MVRRQEESYKAFPNQDDKMWGKTDIIFGPETFFGGVLDYFKWQDKHTHLVHYILDAMYIYNPINHKIC